MHGKYCEVAVLDKEGYIQDRKRINNQEVDKMIELLSRYALQKRTIATLESTWGWYWLADELEKIPNVKLKLRHPLGIKALTCTNKKTDARDSKLLADLTRTNLLPESHITSKVSREFKELVRHRMSLVENRSNLKRRVKACLAKQNLHCPYRDVLEKKARIWVFDNVKAYQYKIQIDTNYALCDHINTEIDRVNSLLEEQSKGIKDI